jgi:hypothetical protein
MLDNKPLFHYTVSHFGRNNKKLGHQAPGLYLDVHNDSTSRKITLL